jgi:amino acid transporter
MIQRIQSLYLLLAATFLALVTFGATIFQFQAVDTSYRLSACGMNQYDAAGELMVIDPSYVYIAGLALLVLCLLTLISFKNLKRQLALGQFTATLYFIFLVLLVITSFMGADLTGEQEVTRSFGFGFYAFAAGLPFLILANIGIKRDKKLLDSVNRLR